MSLWVMSGRPLVHWFFTVEESQLAAHHPVLRYIVAVFSRAQPTLTLSSPITNIHPHSSFLSPCSTRRFFSLALPATLSFCQRDSLAPSCSMASSPSLSWQTRSKAAHTCTWRRRCQGDCATGCFVHFCIPVIYIRSFLSASRSPGCS